jgi:hypothetical protein
MIITSILYLIYCGLLTINAPLPYDSLWGQSQLKDGLLLQIIIVLIIIVRPQIKKDYLLLVLIFLIISGIFNLKIFDHPGTHAGAILILSVYFNSLELELISLIPLLLIGNRSALIGLIPSINNFRFKYWIYLIIFMTVILISTSKQVFNAPDKSLINVVSSGRIGAYQVAINGIIKNPLGYGFLGYRSAFASRNSSEYLLLSTGYYETFGRKGKIKKFPIPYSKSHNLILDKLLDVGIPGTLLWFNLIRLNLTAHNKKLILSYFIFTFFWYESFIFTILFWLLVVTTQNNYPDKVDK